MEKGWTFNYDGTLVDFKKPRQREIEREVAYEVSREAVIREKPSKKGQHKPKQSGGFGATRYSNTDYQTTGGEEKFERKPT